MSTKTAVFRSDLVVDGVLQGPTISGIDTKITNNKLDIETKLNQEVVDRTTAIDNVNTAFNNRVTFTDTELQRLQTQHNSDDTRLTTVETRLDGVDANLQTQISNQIAKHNTDIANLDPRVATLESKFIVDSINKTITIPEDYKFVILGSLEQGGTGAVSSPPPPSGDTPPTQNLADYRWVNDQEGSFSDINFYNSNITYFQSNPIVFGSTLTQVQLDEINNYFGNGGTINELYAGQGDNSFKIVYTGA